MYSADNNSSYIMQKRRLRQSKVTGNRYIPVWRVLQVRVRQPKAYHEMVKVQQQWWTHTIVYAYL